MTLYVPYLERMHNQNCRGKAYKITNHTVIEIRSATGILNSGISVVVITEQKSNEDA